MNILLYAPYINSTTLVGETGLSPTTTIYRVAKSDGATAEVVSAQAMTEVGRGLYVYLLVSVDLTLYDYPAVALTSSSSVTNKEVHMLRWDGAEGHSTELARVDVTLSTIPALVWAYTTRTLSSFGTLISNIWNNPIRTLTNAEILSVDSTPTITVIRGDTLEMTLSDLGSLANRSKLFLTVRKIKSLEDNVSEIQIEETSNLIYLAGAAIVSPVVDTDGTLTVDDETDGDITVLLKPRASKELGAKDYYYDVQIVRADETVTTLRTGTFSVTQDVTRAVS